MIDALNITMRKGQYSCGIYEAGDSAKCYLKLFITDSQRVMAITGRALSEDDLMEVYKWGILDERERIHGKSADEDDEA